MHTLNNHILLCKQCINLWWAQHSHCEMSGWFICSITGKYLSPIQGFDFITWLGASFSLPQSEIWFMENSIHHCPYRNVPKHSNPFALHQFDQVINISRANSQDQGPHLVCHQYECNQSLATQYQSQSQKAFIYLFIYFLYDIWLITVAASSVGHPLCSFALAYSLNMFITSFTILNTDSMIDHSNNSE